MSSGQVNGAPATQEGNLDAPTLSNRLARRAEVLRGALLVASTYVYFLLFAQYGLVRLLQERLSADAMNVRVAMGCMAVAGLSSSIVSARVLRHVDGARALRWAFSVCGAAALLAVVAHSLTVFVVVAIVVGLGLGMLTVTLATHLTSWLHPKWPGLQIGVGTGLAYLVCNLPLLFDGAPSFQASLSALVAGLGCLLVARLGHRDLSQITSRFVSTRTSIQDALPWGVTTLVLSFLALVWLDSAAFNIIQETASLKGFTWDGLENKLAMGSTHFLAAVLAGFLIDRGHLRSLLVGAFALFVVAFQTFEAAVTVPGWAGPLYAVGISMYSTALVAYPSLQVDGTGLVPRRWRAAVMYGVGGWLGSALGVGMAQDLHRIPNAFVWTAGIIILCSALLSGARSLGSQRPGSRGLGAGVWGLGGVWVLLVIVAVGHQLLAKDPPLGQGRLEQPESSLPSAGDLELAEWGRRVYVQEGCINCHSQFLRPRVEHDLEWWGPFRALDRSERPPLIGNRRQGPDLLNAGNRRSVDWHRQHLIEPRSVSPGSRMPSYGHLFNDSPSSGDASPGEALVHYLGQLGEGTATDRFEKAQRASVGDPESGDPIRGRALFLEYCSACHGRDALGEGPVSAAVFGTALNLRKEVFWLPSWGDEEGTLQEGLARLIRFGVPSSNMPGHEWMSNLQLADAVAYLMTLPGTDPNPDEDDFFYFDEPEAGEGKDAEEFQGTKRPEPRLQVEAPDDSRSLVP